MKYTDAHCHLHLPALAPQLAQTLKEHPNSCLAAAAAEESDWSLLVAWKGVDSKHRAICLGLHPCQADLADLPSCLRRLKNRLERGEANAVGEIGLDRALKCDLAKQKWLLHEQLELARECRLPVVLHVVRSHGAMLDTLARYDGVRGVIHGFCGHPQVLQRYLKLGMNISLNCSQLLLSAGSESEEKWREIVKVLPLPRMMLESDCCLDKNGHPRALVDTDKAAWLIAEYKGCSTGEVCNAVAKNVVSFYGLEDNS